MEKYTHQQLHLILENAYNNYHTHEFIENDPISLPHRFSRLQDIEIVAFWVAMLSWGQRKTIINKSNELIKRMDGAPYQFISEHTQADLKNLAGFKHRTFNEVDTLYFVRILKHFYQHHHSLETIFTQNLNPQTKDVGNALITFHNAFFNLPEAPQRTRKHVATPARKSACKRLNMFLRWMVRPNTGGVDFGLWKNISPAQLVCPLDVHVERTAKQLGLLTRKQTDWQAALELTHNLRRFDSQDPVKYDFALFGMGLEAKKAS